jgi:methylated-DNA-protein-cysteine methyltransferase-like protein
MLLKKSSPGAVKMEIPNTPKKSSTNIGKLPVPKHATKNSTNSPKKPIYNHVNQNTPARKKKANTENKLNAVIPSGKKEESFFELVYEVARQIPFGRVTSYGAIAACLGTKLSARMVGWAMNGADKVNPNVPAHRVVNRVGLLSGKHHFKPPGKMEKLLKKEGISVKNDTIVNFKEKFWDPSEEFL